MKTNRRRFMATSSLAALNWNAGSYFRLEQRGGHWWFITPRNEPFFSLGMNHIDSASLRYRENIHIWRDKYRNDQGYWLQTAVAPDLKAWGFNTIGWTQEVVVRGKTIQRHSLPFTFEEYQWAGMPYCHLLPFAELHQWEFETRYPDFFSQDFEDWCDSVARTHCARMAADPKLIGYFYSDCPTWVHTRNPQMKGPIFDPDLLKTEAGKAKLLELATRYYRVTHDAIRRYDQVHLILGDRYEAKAALPDEVLKAAIPFVDVFSFQYFDKPQAICRDFLRWHADTGKPVLLADAPLPGRSDFQLYEPMLRALRELPCCVGWHYCGAYLKNRVRRYGFRDEQEQVNQPSIDAVGKANRETAQWVATSAG